MEGGHQGQWPRLDSPVRSSAELIAHARQRLTAGDVEYAAQCCRAILDHLPAHIAAHILLAECMVSIEQFGQAKELLQRALSSLPDNLRALRALGTAIYETDGLGAAEYVYQIAYDNHSFHQELPGEIEDALGKRLTLSSIGLARLSLNSGQYLDAAGALNRALAVDPRRLDARVLLALAYHRAGDRSTAETVCRDVLQDAPDCLPVLAIMLHHRMVDGVDSKGAQQLASQIAACDPTYLYVREILPEEILTQLPPSEIDVDIPSAMIDGSTSPPPSAEPSRVAQGGESDDWMAKMIRSSDVGGSDTGGAPSVAPPAVPEPAQPTPPAGHESSGAEGLYLKVVAKNQEQDTGSTTEAARQRMNRALQFQQSDRFDEAVAEYASIMRSDPALAGEIVDNLRWIVYAKPNHIAALKTLGDAYMRVGDVENAVEQYDRVMTLRESGGGS